MPEQEEKHPNTKLNIELDDRVSEGTYSNLVMIAHSPEEFIFDFIRVMPGTPKAKVKSRIIVSPQHARRLLKALAENIERYENSYGPIGERHASQPVFQFQIPGGEA